MRLSNRRKFLIRMSSINRLKQYFQDRQLLLMIILAVVASLIMTTIALKLYVLDDVSRLDVSLPNRENIRPESAKDDSSLKFDASGQLDNKAFDDFQKLYSKQRTALSTLGKFDGDSLSNERLRIGSGE